VAEYFFDSSAIVKRYVNETGTAWVTAIVSPTAVNGVRLVRLTTVEVLAAITRRERGGSVAPAVATLARQQFRADIANFHMAEVSLPLIATAMNLAERHALRGSDAVQLAAALEANADCLAQGVSLTLVSADAELNAAAVAEGLAMDDPNLHP